MSAAAGGAPETAAAPGGAPEVDVAIVGGGPAGLATAMAAARSGLRVVVLDPGVPPLDKACGEGLMPDALAVLGRLGVELEGGLPFLGIRFVSGTAIATGSFPGGPGLGLRRTALHAALVRGAERAGVDLRFGVAARGLGVLDRRDGAERAAVATAAGEVRARFVVGADGLRSRVATWAGLARVPGPRPRFGLRRHFHRAPWTDRVEVHWGDGAEAYVTPVGANEIGVALLWSGAHPSYDSLLQRFPELAARLAGARSSSSDRGSGPFHQRVPAVTRGCLALVGDAAGYLDPLTGEGLAIAFHQAEALVAAMAGGDLNGYRRANRRLRRLPEAVTRLMLIAERRPAARRRLIALLGREPEVFSRLLGIQTRQAPARSLGIPAALRLAACLVGPGP